MKTIMIDYTRGDSFGSERVEDEVAAIWEDQSKAEKALSDINEHYSYYLAIHKREITPDERVSIEESIKEKDWFYDAKQYYKDQLEFYTDFEIIKEGDDLYEKFKKLSESDDNSERGNGFWQRNMFLTLDNGMKLKIDVFWCDYFATLHNATIIDI